MHDLEHNQQPQPQHAFLIMDHHSNDSHHTPSSSSQEKPHGSSNKSEQSVSEAAMPAQKRSFSNSMHDPQHNLMDHHSNGSHHTPSSASQEKPQFIVVKLLEIRKEVQCPICLGIIKKTRTVKECLHRFCRECIDKSMRLGNNECPTCRTHCASRRSLRDDPNYDALIAALYPDVEKYEEEELEFCEEEKNRNKLIQASIAKVVQRQSGAVVKRGRDAVGAFLSRSQRNQRNVLSRRQNQVIDIEGSDDNEEDSSSAHERCAEFRQRKRTRQTRVHPSKPSSSMVSADSGSRESDMGISKENQGIFSRLASEPQKFTWGRSGIRSHARHGSGSGSNNKSTCSGRLAKLVDYLYSLDENTDEQLDVHLMLVSLDKQNTPSLQQPYLSCQPTLSVKHLCEYVARQTPLPVEKVEILAVKGCSNTFFAKPVNENSSLMYDELTMLVIDPSKDELESLQEHETLAGLKSKCISKREHLILAYRQKE